MPRKCRDLLDRIKGKYEVAESGCWIWTASCQNGGYGQLNKGRRGEGMGLAHRMLYERLIGPIPEGLYLDHVCRNRRCINPAHLSPVTHSENQLRGMRHSRITHCPRGHAYDLENTRFYQGRRYCKQCRRAASREYEQRKAQARRDGIWVPGQIGRPRKIFTNITAPP